MNKLTVITLLFLAFTLKGFSQEEKLDYDYLVNKYQRSNKTIANPKKNTDPKVWFERGNLFIDISNVNTQYIGWKLPLTKVKELYGEQPDSTLPSADGKNKKMVYPRITIELENDKVVGWEETKNVVPDPLAEALVAFSKCDSLDVAKKYANNKIGYHKIRSKYKVYAALCFRANKNECALENFKKILAIDKNKLDTLDLRYYFNVGLIATNLKNYDEAIKYYQFAADNKYKDSALYYNLKALYYLQKTAADTVKALAVLNAGIQLFPNDVNLLTSIIYHYTGSGQKAKAVEYITKAKELDPNNKIFWYIEGVCYAEIKNMDKAIECYQHAISIDSIYFNPIYRLGEYYLMKAEDIYKEADKERDLKKYQEKVAPAIPIYQKAKEYYEICSRLRLEEPILQSNLKLITNRIQQATPKK
jgi:tetratricopeptide (TPR) repeat protein